ncbi:hypothetical protein QYF61_023081, partial [Mycteria americana]
MSALRADVAARNDIVTDKKKIWVTDVFENSLPRNTATVKCWLPEEDSPIWVVMVVGLYPVNILGLDVLKGRGWEDSNGKEWKFGSTPTTSITAHAQAKSETVVDEYQCLNTGTGPLTAAVPNTAELVSAIQEQLRNILATVDIKDTSPSVQPNAQKSHLRLDSCSQGRSKTVRVYKALCLIHPTDPFQIGVLQSMGHQYIHGKRDQRAPLAPLDSSHAVSQMQSSRTESVLRDNPAGPYSVPCSYFPFDSFFHPLEQPDFYEADYSLNVNLSRCIQLPNSTGRAPRDLTNLQWMWSQMRPLLQPLRYASPPQHSRSDLFTCAKVLNCNTGPGDPPETWLLERVRVLIRDMCICWGYPSHGYRNGDILCNKTYSETEDYGRVKYCGIPRTHYPLKGLPLTAKPDIYFMDYSDTWTCKTSIYLAPLGLVWGCSNGKFYSYLTLKYHTGLKCGLVIPSLCPFCVFSFIAPPWQVRQEAAEAPKPQPKWAISGVYTDGQVAALMFKNIFTPYVTLKRHQFVLENITWQVHLLSNWTRYTLGELNLQVQQVLKMTLQNHLALDIILLKEQGVCGMLNLSDGECCITIHNTSTTIEEARTKMKEIADQTAELFQSLQPKD